MQPMHHQGSVSAHGINLTDSQAMQSLSHRYAPSQAEQKQQEAKRQHALAAITAGGSFLTLGMLSGNPVVALLLGMLGAFIGLLISCWIEHSKMSEQRRQATRRTAQTAGAIAVGTAGVVAAAMGGESAAQIIASRAESSAMQYYVNSEMQNYNYSKDAREVGSQCVGAAVVFA
jgi:hypothetical protein